MNWLDPRQWLLIALFAGSCLIGFKFWEHRLIEQGRDLERTAQEIASAQKTARLTAKNVELDNAYQTEKKRRAVADANTDNVLRMFDKALASTNTGTISGVIDPRPAIASECARDIATLDKHVGGLATQLAGLQTYTREVCLGK